LGPILEYGAVCWDRYWSMERCVGTDTGVWSGVLGPILEYGAVCWDRYWSMERCGGTDTGVCSGVLGPILEYGAVCWDQYREGQVSTLNRVQKRAAKFANNITEPGWETLAQHRLIVRICALF